VKRGLGLFLAVVATGALLGASGPVGHLSAAAPAGTPGTPSPTITGVRLKTITLRVHGKGASIVIEATEPVGYVATRPDPLTITIDFRNVAADGVANSVPSNPRSLVAGVGVEAGGALGAPLSRVRITLSQPVEHHVRSDRNTIVVDLDKPTGQPYIMPPIAKAEDEPRKSAKDPPADAMKALEVGLAPAIDPISALGLTGGTPPTPLTRSPVATLASLQQQPQPAAPAPGQAQAPAPQTALPIGAPQGDQCGQRPFTGSPISLDFQGADLRAVLRTFADVSGLNMVIDPKVNGSVDVALRDVPWDQALVIILRANALDCRVDGSIVRIAPKEVFTAEDKAQADASKAQADAGQLATRTWQLSYAKGLAIVALLKQANVLSNRGTPSVDERTNTVIVTDLQDRLTNAAGLINVLDRPQPQVEIEARIVQTNKNYARQLGVQWGFNGNVSPQLGNTTSLAFPNSGSLGGQIGTTQGPTGGTPVSTAVNLGVSGATSAVGLQLGSVNGAFNLDVALSALETSGNGHLLSTPKISTLNNVAAEMTQGVQIPIQTVANNTVTVSFKDAALTLKVTPQITAANTVIMQIALENSTPNFAQSINGIPPINTQRANTTVLVSDGQTTVIGGIYTSTLTTESDTTPGLSQIPLLGWLFKNHQVSDTNTELLIFITPRIVKNQ